MVIGKGFSQKVDEAGQAVIAPVAIWPDPVQDGFASPDAAGAFGKHLKQCHDFRLTTRDTVTAANCQAGRINDAGFQKQPVKGQAGRVAFPIFHGQDRKS